MEYFDSKLEGLSLENQVNVLKHELRIRDKRIEKLLEVNRDLESEKAGELARIEDSETCFKNRIIELGARLDELRSAYNNLLLIKVQG